MCNSIYQRVNRIATWRIGIFLFVANLACIAGFNWRRNQLKMESPDAKQSYSPDDLYVFLSGIGESGRWLYAWTQVTLDVIYPVVYCLLFAVLLVVLYRGEKLRCLVLLPMLTGIFDLLENFTTAYLAATFKTGRNDALASVAPIFSTGKWWGVTICLVMIPIGVVWKAVGWLRRK
ncbi:MAG: hypothetical protein SF097_27915 [Acidobacteriota bacterium]|nr:hypothetical protein [Acidobacteriota bacterium]